MGINEKDKKIIENFLEEKRKRSDGSYKNLKTQLDLFFIKVKKSIINIKYEDTYNYLKNVIDPMEINLNTKESYRYYLKSFFKYCQKYFALQEGIEYYTVVPDKSTFEFTEKGTDIQRQTSKKEKILTKKQIGIILEYIKEKRNYINLQQRMRDFVLISLEVVTGARISEIRTLNINDINLIDRFFETGFIRNARKTTLRSKKSLLFFFPESIIKYLEEYMNMIKGDWLFPTPFNKYLTKNGANQVYYELRKELGFKFSWHYFRHSMITYLKENECSLNDREMLLNHKPSSIQGKSYEHLEIKKKRDIYDKYYPYKELKYIGVNKK